MPFRITIFNFVSVLLTIVFVLQFSMNTIVFFNFKSNQKYIAQTLCVNRNNPSSTCNGKCYLKKEFKESESKSKQIQSYSKEKIVLFVLELKEIVAVFICTCIIHFSADVTQHLRHVAFDVFHPPA